MEFEINAVCRIMINLSTCCAEFNISDLPQIYKSDLFIIWSNAAKSESFPDLLC